LSFMLNVLTWFFSLPREAFDYRLSLLFSCLEERTGHQEL
jgi:hypothetical protein